MRPSTRQLFRDAKVVSLNGKSFELLLVFLGSDGRVLTREELYERLWGERIVEEANLSQTIYLLRRALDPDGDGRSFIETIPRIGYRFEKHVHETRRILSPRLLGIAWIAAACCAVGLAAGALWPVVRAHTATPAVARVAGVLGEYHLALRTPTHLGYALNYFKQAERAAPGDGVAYAGAASAYALLAEFQPNGSARQRELVSLASSSSAAALRRAPQSSRAVAVLGFIAYRFRDDTVAAANDLKRALAMDPSDSEAHLWYGVLMVREGNLPAAVAEFQAARDLVPTSEVYSRWLARAYAFEQKPEQAIVAARETLQIESDDAPAMLTIAHAQEQSGDLKSALDTLQALVRVDPYEEPFVVPDVARLELRLGKTDPSRVRRVGALAMSGRADPFETALLYLTAGQKSVAMRMLRRTSRSSLAIQRHDPRLLALQNPAI
ncbi:MAG TPA: winged helix-turn-helix domain-containing protein [Candidatus Baltobacteraceae bacterium]|nr:winged helix-turn-helix domain-containing protein [Candidatus Baltobacteraceae bacterium]